MVVVFAYFISLAPNYKSINISETLSVARSTLKENQEIIVFDSKKERLIEAFGLTKKDRRLLHCLGPRFRLIFTGA